MLAAVALCAAAVFVFHAQGGFMSGALLPDLGLDGGIYSGTGEPALIIDGTATFPTEELSVASDSAKVSNASSGSNGSSGALITPQSIFGATNEPASSIRINLLDPEDNAQLADPDAVDPNLGEPDSSSDSVDPDNNAGINGQDNNGQVKDGQDIDTKDINDHTSPDSPESSEAVPDQDVRIDTITRKRDGAARVLIYHTHTEEAYTPTPDFTYRTHGEWHTQNLACSIARVGDELAFVLTEKYGWEVTHDTTDYEPPNFDTAYSRSLQGIAGYTERGETFDLYIDLHRDSYSNSYARNTVTIGETEAARMRLLVGKGGDFSQKPDWQLNLKLSESITDRLNAIAPTLAAPIYQSPRNRYNQHVSPNAILIEMGNNRNTMEEALAAVPYLAEALDAVMGD
ncbi:hypothetical protein FACS1894184_02770 [Clostridia bacterium]|nr:hypothetical protein FACS1894184_02770 [Clostridia bacterium]